MKGNILSVFTRTPLAVGAGKSVGAIDSPVMRERFSRIPIIPGSSLKGVLRDAFRDSNDLDEFFGVELNDKNKKSSAGKILIGEARVLAFPVRSIRGGFAWVTCPLVLNRLKRDMGEKASFNIPDLEDLECIAVDKIIPEGQDKKIVLEEYPLQVKDNNPQAIINCLKTLSQDPVWQGDIDKHFAVISDGMFSYFVENTCEVVTRVKIDDNTGTAKDGGLFNQEQVPSETMFYSVIIDLKGEQFDNFKGQYEKYKVLQIGGDETTGLGICSVFWAE